MNIDELLKNPPDYFTAIDRESIMRAYHVAEQAHSGQKRASGDPYITHCISVARILADMGVPAVVVIAGLLHDTVEDTNLTLQDIKNGFGEEVARLVDGVTKLTQLPRVSQGDQQFFESKKTGIQTKKNSTETPQTPQKSRRKELANETLRKTFLAMGEDIRVVLIKLADRLHNMRTLGYMPEASRKKIAQETLDIFAPLANRLGIWQIKWELENLAFRYVNPEKFKEIAEKVSEEQATRTVQIEKIIARLREILLESNIKADISGRPKHIYSIYRKMEEKEKAFESLMDIRAVRLIVQDIPACYSALGIIHTHWRPIPHEFDDYIAVPKDNFYQSLHTAVIYDDGKPLEVQIRTQEMHENAEFGIAAHWRYKEKSPRNKLYEERVDWLRKLMDWRQDVQDAQEFVDSMKTDVFEDRVFAFTPKGDIIDLPSNSTPIDFAYHVHTEIGNRCRGAKVNGKLVTLDHILKTGDQVEILTAKQGGPSRDWLNPNLSLVKTQRARSKIKAWFKILNREQNLTQGKLLFDRELRRLGVLNVDLETLAQSLEYRTIDDLYVALGCGDIAMGRIINKISEEEKTKESPIELKPSSEDRPMENAVSVLGLKGILSNLAKCCHPAPGDEIIGYITRGRGATIHRLDCPNVLRMKDRERVVKVSWGEPKMTFPIPIQVKAYDRQGLMGDITSILNNDGVNMTDINVKVSQNLATIYINLDISDISQLSRILTKIENLPNVMEAHRLKPG